MLNQGKFRGFLAFSLIAVLILGGLSWSTTAALRIERAHRESQLTARVNEAKFQASKEMADLIRQALWRLDARMAPALAREESRPYPHYLALHSPFPALTAQGVACAPGTVYIPSPLLTAELPEWMSLHFQLDETNGWVSPQVIPNDLQQLLRKQPIELALNNVTVDRQKHLETLRNRYPRQTILASFHELGVAATQSAQDIQRWNEIIEIVQNKKQSRGVGGRSQNGDRNDNSELKNPANAAPQFLGNGTNSLNPNFSNTPEQIDYANRMFVIDRARREGLWAYLSDDTRANNPLVQTFPGKTGISVQTVEVQLGQLRPVWLPNAESPENLVLVRGATVNGKSVFQGILIDWNALQSMLLEEISDLFPDASLKAIPAGEPANPGLAMTGLPVEFVPNTPESNFEETIENLENEASPIRIGLIVAWVSAIVALLAIGFGAWFLIDLSERRIRFVSAVTHELRTPMTTLRLYLDLLSSGMVTEEKQKAEYLTTLNSESDRLHRLIVNVLDFARLEKSRPNVNRQELSIAGFISQIHANWNERCLAANKVLCLENRLPDDFRLKTDPQLLEQIIGNLIDNAQKYSRDAIDSRIFLRVLSEDHHVVFEVEDRGPGVGKRHRRSVFRPFRRGEEYDHKAGGVGLGLALATRWSSLIGGKLTLRAADGGAGACFRVSVPGC